MDETPKIGIFGGTFDPPHLAHLIIAQEAAQVLGLERIFFAPALVPPHKIAVPLSPFDVRMKMVEAAIEENPVFRLTDIERRLPAPNYTVNTVEALRREQADTAGIFLIIGSDSLLDFPSWKEPSRLLSSCHVVVYPRAGSPAENAPAAITAEIDILDVPEIPISSTELRKRVAAGDSIRYWVPDRVLSIIRQERLYQPTLRKEEDTD
jgi:nicotinate-nucleotide adenylyltransferase